MTSAGEVEATGTDMSNGVDRTASEPEFVSRVLGPLSTELEALAAQIADVELSARLRRASGLATWAQRTLSAQSAVEQELSSAVFDLLEAQAGPDELGNAVRSLLHARAGEAATIRHNELEAGPVPSADTVAGYLRSARGFDTVEVARVSALTGGFSKITLLIEATLDGAVHELVIRQVPQSRRAGSLPLEFSVLRRLHASGVPVPEPLWIETEGNALGGPFFVTRRAQGRTVGDVWGAEAATTRLCLEVAGIYARLHQIDPEGLTPPISPRCTAEHLHAMITWQEETLEKRGISQPAELRALIGWLRAHVPERPGPASIIHGDAAFSNLIVDGGQVSAVLDWEAAHLGTPAEELAYLRPSIEPILPWSEFLGAYQDAGGSVPDEGALQFFTVWSHTWRYIGCLWLRQTFDRTGQYESAVAAFVNGPRFLQDAVDAAFPRR